MPVYSLSENDRERCRYHLGWLNVEPNATHSLGFPASSTQALALERAASRLITDGALKRVVTILDRMDCIEEQQFNAITTLGVQSVDSVKFRNSNDEQTVTDLLQAEYERWRGKLASQLGVEAAPLAARGGTPINTPVQTLI